MQVPQKRKLFGFVKTHGKWQRNGFVTRWSSSHLVTQRSSPQTAAHTGHIRTTFLSFVVFAPMKSLTLFLMWPAFSNSVGFGLVVSWWRKSRRSYAKVIVRLLYLFLFSSEKRKKSEKIYLWKKFFWFFQFRVLPFGLSSALYLLI